MPNLATATSCLNCGEPGVTRFCPQCGQKRSEHLPSVVEMVHEVLGTLFAYDGKLWRTLRILILKPGQLTLEYVDGRRAAYVGPFQLFLWLQAIAFGAHRLLFSSDPAVADKKSLAILLLGMMLTFFIWGMNFKRLKNYTHSLLFTAHVWAFLMFWLLLEYSMAVPIANLLIRVKVLQGNVQVGQFVTVSTMAVVAFYLLFALKRALRIDWLAAILQTLVAIGVIIGAMIPLARYL